VLLFAPVEKLAVSVRCGMRASFVLTFLLPITLVACGDDPSASTTDASGIGDDGGRPDAALAPCGTPDECAVTWEQNAADELEFVREDESALALFLRDMPKGADLHNHLSGSVYAETFLDWALADENCIVTSSHTLVFGTRCDSSTQAVPTSGPFYDETIRAWSMKDFVPGVETGRDHFFATFGKFGLVAGAHRNDSILDVATRAASENQLYVETMFNLGTRVGSLAASVWSGTLTAADLPSFYDSLIANSEFAGDVASDVATVNAAASGWRAGLDCVGATPLCDMQVRFVAQVSRTGANDQVFGQLVSAFEMAKATSSIVGANLSSPEDDTRSINNYELHMAMLDFLYNKYTVTGESPLRITLHAGELVPAYLPPGSNANTFHIRAAVETGHAERIGHGLDVMSETDPTALLDEMASRNVLVEVCLSSNDQILEVRGSEHPLAEYLAHGVPVTLATDDQGVSRSSLAGEYVRAVRDQNLDYRQLKTISRQSLEHAFLPGDSLWTSLPDGTRVEACADQTTTASSECSAFLETSERASLQWQLERRFLEFESNY
jgi:adenosine deaminase